MREKLWRVLVRIHRYAGIAIGFLVLLWCLSGFVMMYVQYPALMPNEKLKGLSVLNFNSCCRYPSTQSFANVVVDAYNLQSLDGTPILQLVLNNGSIRFVNLESGEWVSSWRRLQFERVGQQFAANQQWLLPVDGFSMSRDQWTVSARFDRHRPLIKFSNEQGKQWYVSSLTADVVQSTTRSERFWNWLGAVPHWLYPTVLRQHATVWAQTVVWLSIVALFLTITGLVIGVNHYQNRRFGKFSPYRGWMLWHHYAGLIFGLFTLTWIFSGLLSMNPWGSLESRSFQSERNLLNGVDRSVSEVFSTIQRVQKLIPKDVVRVADAHWMGTSYVMALNQLGQRSRWSATGKQKLVSEAEMVSAAKALRNLPVTVKALDDEDSYYYGLHGEREFPIFRFSYEDGERYYVSATSGKLIQVVDRNAQWSRWAFRALHTGDFSAIFRRRPFWDVMMLILLVGVSVGVASGTYLGIRRIARGGKW